MAYAERFEDLIAWKKARELTKVIYLVTRQGKFARDFGLRDQMQRAAVSIMSNIAEGFERGNKGDFHRLLAIAKASCGEVRSQLYIAHDIGYLSAADFDRLLQQSIETGKIISGLQQAVHQKWKSGN